MAPDAPAVTPQAHSAPLGVPPATAATPTSRTMPVNWAVSPDRAAAMRRADSPPKKSPTPYATAETAASRMGTGPDSRGPPSGRHSPARRRAGIRPAGRVEGVGGRG